MEPGRAKDIFQAVEQDDVEGVKYFVEERKVTLTDTDSKYSQTPAHLATRNGNLKILKYLLKKEPNLVDIEDFNGNKIFFVAIENNRLDIVKYLAEQQLVNIRERNSCRSDNTGIHTAAEYGHLDILKYFVNQNGNVNILNRFHQPPVFFAAECKHQHIIKYLVEEKNANLTLTDVHGHNILFKAVTNDDVVLMKYVLDKRKVPLDINRKDNFGATLIHRAAALNKYQALVYLVDEKHGDIDTVDIWKQTPLHSAARLSHYAVSKFLLDRGANTEKYNNLGLLPVYEAKEYRIRELIKNASVKFTKSPKRKPRSTAEWFRPREFSFYEDQMQKKIGSYSHQTIDDTEDTFNPLQNMDSLRLQAHLALAGIFYKWNRRSGYQVKIFSVLSPRQILRNRIDSMTIGFVTDNEFFSNK